MKFSKKELGLMLEALEYQYTNVSHINRNKTKDLKKVISKIIIYKHI